MKKISLTKHHWLKCVCLCLFVCNAHVFHSFIHSFVREIRFGFGIKKQNVSIHFVHGIDNCDEMLHVCVVVVYVEWTEGMRAKSRKQRMEWFTFKKFNCVNYTVWKNRKKRKRRRKEINVHRTYIDWWSSRREWTTNKDDDDDEISFHLSVVNGFDVQIKWNDPLKRENARAAVC